ncbi:MAG: hypothetical protein GY732_20895 [Gammaproteobacteria bacterium]|nr:hypothetical protein [Gammaproteobacteria bacterium]
MNGKGILVSFGLTIPLILVSMTCLLQAADYYVLADADGGGNGTSGMPWTWDEMISNLGADGSGNTVYCRGGFGDIAMGDGDPCGVAGDWLTFAAWSGYVPEANTVVIGDGTGDDEDVYQVWDGWFIDHGATSDANALAFASDYDECTFLVNGVGYLTLQNSTLHGQTVDIPNDTDFSPYGTQRSSVFVLHKEENCDNITLSNCNVKYGYEGIRAHYTTGIHTNLLVTDCNVGHCANDCVKFSGNTTSFDANCIVQDCNFSDQQRLNSWFHQAGTWTGSVPAIGTPFILRTTEDVNDGLYVYVGTPSDGVMAGRAYFSASHSSSFSIATPAGAGWDNYTMESLSDPCNLYYTFDTSSGDYGHADCMGIEAGRGITVQRCRFEIPSLVSGQGVKFGGSGELDTVLFQSNVLSQFVDVGMISGTYMLFINSAKHDTSNLVIQYNTLDATGATHNVHERGMRVSNFGSGTGNVLANNIISGCLGFAVDFDVRDYNIWEDSTANNGSWGANSQSGVNFDTLFADRYRDYSVAKVSAVQVNEAWTRYTVIDDYAGTLRPQGAFCDIGAYEFPQDGD